MTPRPPWRVALIGGASGVGKTSVAYRVARHVGAGITEIDDLQVALERMTTPERFPALHAFRHDLAGFRRLDDAAKLAVAVGHAEAMAEPLAAVIANRLDGGPPLVLEGDFFPPTVAVRPTYDGVPAAGRVRAVVLHDDEAQIGRNFLAREGEPQPERARASWRYGEWLCREAERLGLPTVAARPWDTLLERMLALLGAAE